MNESQENTPIEDDEQLKFLESIMRYQDGALSPAEIQELAEAVCNDPSKRKLFQQVQLRTAAIHDLFRMDAFSHSGKLQDERLEEAEIPPLSSADTMPSKFKNLFNQGSDRPVSRKRFSISIALTVMSLLVVFGLLIQKESAPPQIVGPDPAPSSTASPVILTGEVRARFFDQVVLAAGNDVELSRDYMLQDGIVELKFPSGATTIIEAPSIFRVASANRLILNTGACSVHAPPGAEGFEVITPVTKVVDRGTRFYVKVQDNNEAEVHVIEGAADLYSLATSDDNSTESDKQEPVSDGQQTEFVKLTNGEAARIGGFSDQIGRMPGFDPQPYRFNLPDRLVSYQASSTEKASVDELVSLTVQRNGRLKNYSVEELVPIEVTWFCSDPEREVNGYMSGFRQAPSHPAECLEDRNLITGLINFGGQPSPLDHLSIVKAPSGAVTQAPPGLGIRFRKPVINHAGPDLVLFEVQLFTNPLDGDPFHVYPVSDRADLKPLTVTKFDLTMNSPGLRELTKLWSHRYPNVVESLEELRTSKNAMKVNVSHLHFRVIGVGIDLSELGYADGEEVEELFFQHAALGDTSKSSKVDPVFIAGLPPLKPGD